MLAGTPQDRMRTDDQDATQVAIALFGDWSKLLFAAGRILSRHKSDPGRKIATRPERFGSVTMVAMVVALKMPMPGMVSSRLLASLERCSAMIRFSIDQIRVCRESQAARPEL
jgi:hypothetical protein